MNQQTTQGKPNSKTAVRSFWATILFLAGMVITAESGLLERDKSRVSLTKAEEIITEAAKAAHSETAARIDGVVDEAYESVYDAIPKYAEFHYSVIGEYTELYAALVGDMAKELEQRLFGDFSADIEAAGIRLDRLFVEAYRRAVVSETTERLPGGIADLDQITGFVLKDSLDRAIVTKPVAATAATLAGSGGLRALTAKSAALMAKKLIAKMGIKAGAKATAALAGGGTGALACSWGGPLAVVCGVAGAVGAWIAVDAVIINVDEMLNREEFEAELQKMVDVDRAMTKDLFRKALTQKAIEVENFTLRQIYQQNQSGSTN